MDARKRSSSKDPENWPAPISQCLFPGAACLILLSAQKVWSKSLASFVFVLNPPSAWPATHIQPVLSSKNETWTVFVPESGGKLSATAATQWALGKTKYGDECSISNDLRQVRVSCGS